MFILFHMQIKDRKHRIKMELSVSLLCIITTNNVSKFKYVTKISLQIISYMFYQYHTHYYHKYRIIDGEICITDHINPRLQYQHQGLGPEGGYLSRMKHILTFIFVFIKYVNLESQLLFSSAKKSIQVLPLSLRQNCVFSTFKCTITSYIDMFRL